MEGWGFFSVELLPRKQISMLLIAFKSCLESEQAVVASEPRWPAAGDGAWLDRSEPQNESSQSSRASLESDDPPRSPVTTTLGVMETTPKQSVFVNFLIGVN